MDMSVATQSLGGRAAPAQRSLSFIIAASSVGTLIEWYDFYIYGVLAVFFSQHFFPPGNETIALLASLGIFWTGFVVRPLGSVIFGHFGDRVGRKFTFMLTLLLMGAATFLVGVLPDYSSIGVLAPVALVVLRIVQGLALGGEYGGVATYIAEHAPDGRRGFYTAWIQTTATLGIVMALGVILLCRVLLGDEAFTAWGWRVAVVMSALLVIASAWIRLRLEESPLFTELKAQGKRSVNPVGESFGNTRNWKLILLALFGATAPEGVVWYTSQFYVLFYLTTVLHMAYSTVYTVMMVALALAAPFFVVFGSLSDRIGRRNIMVTGFVLAVLSYWPVFTWFGSLTHNPGMLTVLVFYLALLVTMVYGPIAAF